MIGSVAGSVYRHPITTGKTKVLCISESYCRRWQPQETRYFASDCDPGASFPRDLHTWATPRRSIPWHARLGTHFYIVNVGIRWFCGIPKHTKLFMSDDVATRIGLQPMSSAEVVGVAMGDNHRMHSLERNTDLIESFLDDFVTTFFWQTRVNQCHAAFIFKNVHIDVTETWN